MNISFETPDKINGLLTIVVEEADYSKDVEKTLKDYRKKANIPGFRPGMVPMGIIKRQFGTAVKADAINKFVGEQMQQYIRENHIQMLGEPLPSERHEQQDLEKADTFTFKFDIAVAPEIHCELSAADTIDYYNITVDDALIDRQVEMFASQMGSYVQADHYEGNDTIKGDLRELDENGNSKEGGVTVEAAILMPSYIKVEEQKQLFDNAKPGDIITFNPRKAYPENDSEVASLLKIQRDEVAAHTGDFSYQVTEVQRFEKAEVNAELWEGVYGKESGIKDEAGFREAIAKGLKGQLEGDSDYKFMQDVRAHVEKKIGKLEYPEQLLKRIMLANNKDKDQEFVDKNYDQSIKELTWSMAKEQLAQAQNIKVEDADVLAAAKEMARAQFAMYGMNNVPEEYVDNFAKEQLKKRENVDRFVDRALDTKLAAALKNVVKLNHKEVDIEEFNKMMGE